MSETKIMVRIEDVKQMHDVMVLYSKKNAFTIEEYFDTGSVWKRLASIVEKTNKTDEFADVDEQDVKFVVNAIDVCSQRATVERQNYKPIYTLYDSLVEILSKSKSD